MPEEPYLTQTDLFIGGTNGYDIYRIPSIVVTTKGTLLAFCEGRTHHGGDSGDIDLLLKRSVDNGQTWSKQQIIWDDGPNTCGNPCAVVDKKTGTIWLLMTHNLGVDKEYTIIDGTSQGTRTVWVTHSNDDGQAWTKPKEITNTVKQPDWTWYATGPGAGIQLKNGRLVIPCDHIEVASKKYYSHVIYSDDHGQTWQRGGSTPGDQVNECEVVELDDHTLLLNMRNYDRTCKTRAVATSQDGGLPWSAIAHDAALIEPICQASIRRLTLKQSHGVMVPPLVGCHHGVPPGVVPIPHSNKNRILFSNPASRDERTNMTVRLSYDEGKTWPVAKQLNPGPSAYSCLTVLPDTSIVCFYERGREHPYEKITLARFNLEWLTDGKDSLSRDV